MDIHRRELLRRLGLGIAGIPLLHACGTSSGGAGVDGASADTPSGGGPWASGGTGSMTDKASYPDPFTGVPATCALVATTTAGPCTTATELSREDISEGWTGLPVRLGLKVVDSACTPIAGATVKIWHTNHLGSYSGQTPNNAFCLKTSSYATVDFMRGARTTSRAGIVYFDTCYPGWYPGRAIHIHVQVLIGNVSTRVSQLFFPEPVTRQIFASHVDYQQYGQPDTTFATDSVLSGVSAAERDRLIADVARMTDGAMLASKVVTVTG